MNQTELQPLSRRQQLRLHILIIKLILTETKNNVVWFIGSRIRIIGLTVFPPKTCESHRLESDPEALLTMTLDQQKKYWAWLVRLRMKAHHNCCHS